MDQKTISLYLSRILSGFYLFFYKGEKYKLIYPDIHIKYEAELYAQEEYEKNKFNDWLFEDNIVDTLIDSGLWPHNGDSILENLEKQIEDYKVDLYKNCLNPNKLKTLRKTLNNIKRQHNHLYNIRHSLDHITPLGYSQIQKNYYILINAIYDYNNELVFKSINNLDYYLFNNLSSVINNNTIDIVTFRIIARNDLWKNYWSANNDNLFNKSTINWTDEQKSLVVLTKMYESAYQHPECPPDKVFDDDDMFDGWMINQKRENEKNKNKNRTEKMLEGKNLGNAGEIFLVANSQEEVQNIYNLNDNNARHIIKERNTVILNSTENINDQELPDVQRNLLIQSNNQFKNHFRK